MTLTLQWKLNFITLNISQDIAIGTTTKSTRSNGWRWIICLCFSHVPTSRNILDDIYYYWLQSAKRTSERASNDMLWNCGSWWCSSSPQGEKTLCGLIEELKWLSREKERGKPSLAKHIMLLYFINKIDLVELSATIRNKFHIKVSEYNLSKKKKHYDGGEEERRAPRDRSIDVVKWLANNYRWMIYCVWTMTAWIFLNSFLFYLHYRLRQLIDAAVCHFSSGKDI